MLFPLLGLGIVIAFACVYFGQTHGCVRYGWRGMNRGLRKI